ncbi:MAG: type II secretion system secretin GspD [Myxococcota bacterium]
MLLGLALVLGVALAQCLPFARPASAQGRRPVPTEARERVSLDFNDVELPVVIDTISRMTGYNFIYDDRVRGRVTIVSPTEVTVDQAFAVFESVLKVKGFSLVLGPGNTYKVIPIRDVKESSIDTIRGGGSSPNRDRFVTRLIPLSFIDAEAITNTIKPLVSKDALIVAYQPTNTIIVTDSESNIRRLMQILDAIDVESYRQELAVIKIEHADAGTLGDQISEIYGGNVSVQAGGATASQRRARARQAAGAPQAQNAGGGPIGPDVTILPDERTNSLLVLASRQQLADIRGLIEKLDIPVVGQGRIQVYYLRFADAEELSETLNSLLGSGGSSGSRSTLPGAASNVAQSLRSVVTPLADGVTITADPATNSLVIQASKEAYETLAQVIEKLDVSRPQVLVEALIVEVDVTDALDLGFNAAYRIINGDTDILFATGAAGPIAPGAGLVSSAIRSTSFSDPTKAFDQNARPDRDGTGNLSLGITANQSNNDVNIVSAPHILTSDNEEAEIKIGQNIPIVTGRTQAPSGTTGNNLAQAVSVQRQDVGVTLRVTPQISEGDTLRLEIFQELTEVAESAAGNVEDVGVTLSSRKVENTVVVNDGETVAIGGLISEVYSDNVNGVPWLADIPFLGWAFKTKNKDLRKINLLVFLTPHIVRNADDLERNTIRKRIELEDSVDPADRKKFPELAKAGIKRKGTSSVASELNRHADRYPIERMQALEQEQQASREERREAARRKAEAGAQHYVVDVATFFDETEATEQLITLIDAGYDGSLASRESGGRVVFTIQVGPFDDVWEAEQAAQTLDESYGFDSTVALQRKEEP